MTKGEELQGQALRRTVLVAVYESANFLTLAALLEIFALANRFSEREEYKLIVCSEKGGPIATSEGLQVMSDALADIADQDIDTLVLGGGWGYASASRTTSLPQWAGTIAARARRVCALGGGVFVGAEAGILDGRRVTIHPRVYEEFKARFTHIEVDCTSLFRRDGNVWTSPGMAATIDLALAVVEDDLGYERTIEIARFAVVYMRRTGRQSQVSLMLEFQSRSSRFSSLNQWIADNLHADLDVDRLARQANMSLRSFSRLYTQEMGASPAKVVAALRIEAAMTALQDGQGSIANIAYRCGFGNEDRMRRAFIRQFNKPPSAFRNR